ncbi:response regulator [Paenibacillus sp. TRM 82003]|nr:response regulator [Paenibacillus sp. TRM 82003]
MYDILLVDDERWVRTALRKVIEKVQLPFRVAHEATNGVEAVDWMASNRADIVLTDIRMPVMDGLALLSELKRKGAAADVIIVSGHDDFSYAQQALRGGAYDYILKPVETDDLAKCLGGWLDARRSAGSRHPDRKDVPVDELSPVEQVLRHVEDNFGVEFTLSQAAELVHLNPSYFCKLFKQQQGVTFTDYVTEVRMKEAVRLLERTSLRVTEIAARLGYADPAYFSNTFKKVVGMPPSEVRKQQVAGDG